MNWTKTTAMRDEKHFSFWNLGRTILEIWRYVNRSLPTKQKTRQSLKSLVCIFRHMFVMSFLVLVNIIWVRSRRWACLVIWFCYDLIAKSGNKTSAPSWPDPYTLYQTVLFTKQKIKPITLVLSFVPDTASHDRRGTTDGHTWLQIPDWQWQVCHMPAIYTPDKNGDKTVWIMSNANILQIIVFLRIQEWLYNQILNDKTLAF